MIQALSCTCGQVRLAVEATPIASAECCCTSCRSAQGKTRRVLATCCNAPLLLEFSGGHWLSLYGRLWPDGMQPLLQMRTITGDLPDPSVLPNDVPNARSQTLAFFARLLGAWVAMGFRSPKVAAGGEIHA